MLAGRILTDNWLEDKASPVSENEKVVANVHWLCNDCDKEHVEELMSIVSMDK